MAGTEWEKEQSSHAKHLVIIIWIAVPIIIVSGVFLFNNRDFFTHSDQSTSSKSSDVIEVVTPVVEKSEPKGNDTVLKDENSVAKNENDTLDSSTTVNSSVKISDRASDLKEHKPLEIHDSEDIKKPGIESYVILPAFECRTFDRKDITLQVSVKLFYKEEIPEKKIAILRNDMVVVIQRLINEKELSSLKKEPLKQEILHSVNTMIGQEIFSDMQYLDFKIEKVAIR